MVWPDYKARTIEVSNKRINQKQRDLDRENSKRVNFEYKKNSLILLKNNRKNGKLDFEWLL